MKAARDERLLLQDILDSIAEVITHTPSTKRDFDSNKLVQSHLVRHIQIIGEAAWRLPDAFKVAHPQVPWRAIAGMRHAIVHNYFEVDWNEVYNTATNDIPALQLPIRTILDTLPR